MRRYHIYTLPNWLIGFLGSGPMRAQGVSSTAPAWARKGPDPGSYVARARAQAFQGPGKTLEGPGSVPSKGPGAHQRPQAKDPRGTRGIQCWMPPDFETSAQEKRLQYIRYFGPFLICHANEERMENVSATKRM